MNKIIIFYRSSKASIKTEDLAKAIVFNATKKTITEGKTETIEHADILDISKEATEIPKVSLNNDTFKRLRLFWCAHLLISGKFFIMQAKMKIILDNWYFEILSIT